MNDVNVSVREAVQVAAYGAVTDAVNDAVDIAVRGAVNCEVRDAALRYRVRDTVWDRVSGALGDVVRVAVWDEVEKIQ